MPSICPQLTQLYQAWSDSFTMMEDARLSYQETGSPQDKAAFDHVLSQAKQAQENYRKVAHALVEYNGSSLIQIEALVMGGIDDLLRTDLEWIARLKTDQGHIVILDVMKSQVSTSSIDRAVVLAVSYLQELKELYCYGTKLASLPDHLSDSLQRLDCYGTKLASLPDHLSDSLNCINIQKTPVAKDPEVQKKLKAFQEAHPGAVVFL